MTPLARRLLALVGAAWALALVASAAHADVLDALASRRWSGVRAPHCEVITDAGPAVAERVARQVEQLHAVMRMAAPELVLDGVPVQVIVFRERAEFEVFAPRWEGRRDEVAGFFQPAVDRPRLWFAAEGDRLPRVAQHEYTHALLENALPDLPLWLGEGLAEYFSTFSVQGRIASAGEPLREHLDWLKAHPTLPLPRLFAVGHRSPEYHEGDRRGTFYAQSWALTHLLLTERVDDLERLERCIREARDGESFEEVFRGQFGDEYSLRVRLDAYLARPRWVRREWALPRELDEVAMRSRIVPAAEVLATIGGGLLARTPVPMPLAEGALRRALALDPGQMQAVAGRGVLALERGDEAEARSWTERVIASTDAPVAAVKLVASRVLPRASRSADGAVRERTGLAVRRALERARAREPEDPVLPALLARTWVLAPGRDATPGLTLAREAEAALPGRREVRLDLLLLAALSDRAHESAALERRWFARSTDPEVKAGLRRAHLVASVRRAARLADAGDLAGAESALRAARAEAEDPAETRQVDEQIAALARARTSRAETARENEAIREYNVGVAASNAERHAEAAAAFRRAAARTGRASFRAEATAMAERMDLRLTMGRVESLVRAGRRGEALRVLEGIDRTRLNAEDRRWVEENRTRLRGGR